MALIRDPNWTGPGLGPLIDDGTGSTPKSGRGQFTPEQAAAIDAAASSAAGYSGDAATADYIRQLQSGALGGGADTQAALNRLIEQGKARNVAERGNEEFFAGYDPGGRPESSGATTTTPTSVVPKDDNETATTILRNTLKFYGLDQPELVRRNSCSPSQPHYYRRINSRRNRYPTT
jgi:hypothetical protein